MMRGTVGLLLTALVTFSLSAHSTELHTYAVRSRVTEGGAALSLSVPSAWIPLDADSPQVANSWQVPTNSGIVLFQIILMPPSQPNLAPEEIAKMIEDSVAGAPGTLGRGMTFTAGKRIDIDGVVSALVEFSFPQMTAEGAVRGYGITVNTVVSDTVVQFVMMANAMSATDVDSESLLLTQKPAFLGAIDSVKFNRAETPQ